MNFKNTKELYKYLNNNPEVVIKQNIGKIVKGTCTGCQKDVDLKIVDVDKFECQECGHIFNYHIVKNI